MLLLEPWMLVFSGLQAKVDGDVRQEDLWGIHAGDVYYLTLII